MKIQPRSILEAKIREIIDDQTYNAYICGRDWPAWEAGTMTREDFTKLSDSPRFEELVNDIMDAVCGAKPPDSRPPGPCDIPGCGPNPTIVPPVG